MYSAAVPKTYDELILTTTTKQLSLFHDDFVCNYKITSLSAIKSFLESSLSDNYIDSDDEEQDEF